MTDRQGRTSKSVHTTEALELREETVDETPFEIWRCGCFGSTLAWRLDSTGVSIMTLKIKSIFALALLAASGAASAGINSVVVLTPSIPAVTQPGLIALAFVVGLIGAHLIRKRRAP